MAKNKEPKEKKYQKFDGMALQILISIVCILIGSAMLFIPEIELLLVVRVFCWALLAAGVVAIVRYLLTQAYKRLRDYRFAEGVLFLILGVVGLLRAADVAGSFEVCIGLVALILGVIMLQAVLQAKVVDSVMWVVELVFAVVTLLGSVFILLGRKLFTDFPYWVLLVAGCLSLLSLLILAIVLRGYQKHEEAAAADDAYRKDIEPFLPEADDTQELPAYEPEALPDIEVPEEFPEAAIEEPAEAAVEEPADAVTEEPAEAFVDDAAGFEEALAAEADSFAEAEAAGADAVEAVAADAGEAVDLKGEALDTAEALAEEEKPAKKKWRLFS